MLKKPSLKDILIEDEENAVVQTFESIVLPAGKYVGKVIGFVEEETYQYITMEVDSVRINFFYNYYIYETVDLDGNTIAWIKALATIPVTPKTSLLEIANASIGSTYGFEVYNYIPKKGKNIGVTQHSIDFKVLPVIETAQIIKEEEIKLPY